MKDVLTFDVELNTDITVDAEWAKLQGFEINQPKLYLCSFASSINANANEFQTQHDVERSRRRAQAADVSQRTRWPFAALLLRLVESNSETQ
jgi:hypothetical protein